LKRTQLQSAFGLQGRQVGRQVLSGAVFQVLVIVSRTAITIGSTAVLARLLTPADFGYLAMATVVTELAALFANFGFANILIQRRQLFRIDLDTMFWASLGLGIVLALCVLAASLFVQLWFGDELVGPVLQVLSLSFLVGALTTVPWVILSRLMRFRTEFWIQLTAMASRAALAIFLAWKGWGVWSLVAAALFGSLVQAILGLYLVGYWPRLRFKWRLLSSTWKASGSYFSSGVLYYANSNIDLLLVGRSFGATGLGLYQTARGLSDEIRARIAVPLQNVLFPAFSAVQQDIPAAQQLFLRAGRIIAAFVMPVGVFMAALSPELVRALYGPRWLEMIPLVAVFGLGGALRASLGISIPVINAWNHLGRSLKFQVIGTVLTITSIVVALPFGLQWVAIAIVTVSLYSFVPYRYAMGLLQLGAWRGLSNILLPAMAAAVGAAVILLLRPATETFAPGAGWRLLVLLSAGGLAYLTVLLAIGTEHRAEAGRLVAFVRKSRS
jgi:O-antigen/teichoic acid export membrane protein